MTADVRAWLRDLTDTHNAATVGVWTAERIFWKLGSTRGAVDGWWWDITDAAGTVAMVPTDDDESPSETDGAARAAAIVAEHNATPALVAALTAVLDLADELEADIGSDYASGVGSTISRPAAGRRIRAAVAAATDHTRSET